MACEECARYISERDEAIRLVNARMEKAERELYLRLGVAESSLSRAVEALLSLARIETDEEGSPVLVISCGFHCQTSDQTELPLVWAALAEIGGKR